MAAGEPASTNRYFKPSGRTALWALLILAAAALLGALYFILAQNQAQAVNRHYFRVLADAASTFNNNLDQVSALSKYQRDKARSLYPNYRKPETTTPQDGEKMACGEQHNERSFEIKDGRFYYRETIDDAAHGDENPARDRNPASRTCWHLPVADLLPKPSKDFSQFLLVNRENTVLAKRGDRQALSIIKTDEFAKQIAVELNRDWIQLVSSFSDNQQASQADANTTLPGFSHYLDIQLNPGEFRIYIYPFSVDPGFALTSTNNSSSLYLIGVLPKTELRSQHSKRWNLGLVCLFLTLLMFAWVMVHLFMLSEHQPVESLFYYLSMYSSYCLFAALGSLLFADGEMRLERAAKTQAALELASKTAAALQQDLEDVFTELVAMKRFYSNILDEDGRIEQRALQQYVRSRGKHIGDGPHFSIIECVPLNDAGEPQSCEQVLNDGKHEGKRLLRFFGPGFSWKGQSSGEGSQIARDRLEGQTDKRFLDAQKRAQTPLIVTFVMNASGVQVGPQFFYQESSHTTGFLDLSHREYFKKIARNQGWQADKVAPDFHHLQRFYIQRLRNVTDGVLGATVGIPLILGDNLYVLAADIDLPSVAMLLEAVPSEQQDMTLMVVDRHSGEVLFHYDDQRVLTENLYSAGKDSRAIQYAVQTGRDSRVAEDERSVTLRPVQGHYQGFPGWFLSHATPIDQWSLVIFFPNESADNYLSNIFFVNFIHFVGLLLLVHVFLWLVWTFASYRRIRDKLNIPPVIERRKLMLFTSVVIFSQIGGYWMGHAIDTRIATIDWASWLVPFALMLLSFVWGMRACQQACLRSRWRRGAETAGLVDSPSERKKHQLGIWLLVGLFALFALAINSNLNRVGERSSAALSWYYKNLAVARINREKNELQTLALNRYPESVSAGGQDPYKLLGAREPQVVVDGNKWQPKFAELQPSDVMYFSQLTRNTDLQRWLQLYLFDGGASEVRPRAAVNLWGYFAITIPTALLLVWLWVYFNRKILYVRLFGTEDMLCYLNKLYRQSKTRSVHQPEAGLELTAASLAPTGQNLLSLLEQKRQGEKQLPEAFVQLCGHSELLQAAEKGGCALPAIDIAVELKSDGLWVSLVNLEDHLADEHVRAQALALIKHLKGLQRAGCIEHLTLACDIHFPIVLLTASNMQDVRAIAPDLLSGAEYCAWASTLKDFSVQLPGYSTELLDEDFLRHEIQALPALAFIGRELGWTEQDMPDKSIAGPHQRYRWARLSDRHKNHREWHSIRHILLKAGALYRYIWCSCNSEERLALYYLARNRRVNPSNIQVLESLALRGLIKVYRGRVRIVNQSFAYFVRHSEDMDTIKDLIRHGDLGAWQDYKALVSAAILVLFAAVAVWSGNSVYVIISSVLGALGLVGNLMGNVGFIRSNMFE